ncbi:Bgt-50532 [Blumeria graminis f. sp. tritici]|uniref:Bgt-50532 n=1 Tax=Blumeria graminis f. sp. tritici TaxID=62690 RepID=A0A9X9MNC7_BLUGR|nr:Bgt-50532 [Blumeria graminis f. sp. tritici]
MNPNLVLALLSKHLHPMFIELAIDTPISPSIAILSYIPKAASLPFSYIVITHGQGKGNRLVINQIPPIAAFGGQRLTPVRGFLYEPGVKYSPGD